MVILVVKKINKLCGEISQNVNGKVTLCAKRSPKVNSQLSTLIVRQNHTFFKVKAKTRKPSFMKGKIHRYEGKVSVFWLRFIRILMKQCYRTKKGIRSEKHRQKERQKSFLYFFHFKCHLDLEIKNNITADHRSTSNFPLLKEVVLAKKNTTSRNDRYKIIGRELAGGMLVLWRIADTVIVGVVLNLLSVAFQRKVSNCITSHNDIHCCLKHASTHFLLLFSISWGPYYRPPEVMCNQHKGFSGQNPFLNSSCAWQDCPVDGWKVCICQSWTKWGRC